MSIKNNLFLTVLLFSFSCKKKNNEILNLKTDFFIEIDRCSLDSCYVNFYDNSLNVSSREWDFGNGENSINQQDSTVYRKGLTVDVVLKISDEVGHQVEEKKTLNFN